MQVCNRLLFGPFSENCGNPTVFRFRFQFFCLFLFSYVSVDGHCVIHKEDMERLKGRNTIFFLSFFTHYIIIINHKKCYKRSRYYKKGVTTLYNCIYINFYWILSRHNLVSILVFRNAACLDWVKFYLLNWKNM